MTWTKNWVVIIALATRPDIALSNSGHSLRNDYEISDLYRGKLTLPVSPLQMEFYYGDPNDPLTDDRR